MSHALENREMPILDTGLRLSERIGRGGMATVYRAETPDGPVAVKLAKPTYLNIEVALLNNEIGLLERINHPNVIHMRHNGLTVPQHEEEELPYMVLDYAPATVYDRLHDGQISPQETAELITDAAIGLHHLHEDKGIIHRDVKPANMLIGPTGEVILCDLGFAIKPNSPDETVEAKKIENIGTPAYLPPEIWVYQPHTSASDVYALAGTAFQAVTGITPFSEVNDGTPPTEKYLENTLRDSLDKDHQPFGRSVLAGLATNPLMRPNALEFAENMADALPSQRGGKHRRTITSPAHSQVAERTAII